MQQSFLNHVSFFFHFTISSTCTCILSFLIITINHNSTEYASPFLYHVTVQAFRIQITRWSKMSVICYRRYNQEYIRSLCLYRFFQRFTCYIIQYAEDKMALLQINLQVKYVIYSFFCVEVKLIKITVGFYKGQSK